MIPHTQDPKPADLAAQITAASTPSQITAVADSITTFLLSHDHHHHRRFFSLTFPTLISRLFGFDHRNPPRGWISTAPSSPLLSLLSPTSPLFTSISAVDRLSLVKYVFPIERLPPWAHLLLSKHNSSSSSSSLLLSSPLFRNRVRLINGLNQIELNVFDYFIFWFAYYPLSIANAEGSKGPVIIPNQNPKKRLENWAHSLPRFPTSTKKANEKKTDYGGLYTRLLYAYLREFVPMYDFNGSQQPYRSSLLHYSRSFDSSVSDRAEFFVDTLVQFWLVDSDFSPVPVNKSFGVNVNLRAFVGETPPASGLGEVVGMFVKYVNLSWAGDQIESCNAADNVSLLVQRPLYRYILRTFLFCPMESSMKNVSQVFSVWMSYVEPWAVGLSDFKKLEEDIEKSRGESRTDVGFGFSREPSGYSSAWQGFVVSNYLFFSSLVMHFIGFAHKFLHADPEAIVKMVSKVMDVLTSCTELTDLIKNVDTVFHAIPLRSSKSVLNSLQKFVPSIREQLQDWEDGLCESDADGSFLHDNWNKDLRLFCQSENGGQQLLQLFVLRAESELQAISSNNTNLQCLNLIRKQTGCLFGGSLVKPLPISFEERQFQDPRHEIFKPRQICNGKSANIKYKGDWMKRPVSNDEVAWLAKLMVSLSCWLNGLLGLNQDQNADVAPGLSYVDVSDDVVSASGSAELAKMISHAVASFFVGLFRILVWCMKKYGLRVNLRVLASKKVLTVFIVAFGLNLLRKYITGA